MGRATRISRGWRRANIFASCPKAATFPLLVSNAITVGSFNVPSETSRSFIISTLPARYSHADTSENRNPRAAIEAKGLASGYSDNGLQGYRIMDCKDTSMTSTSTRLARGGAGQGCGNLGHIHRTTESRAPTAQSLTLGALSPGLLTYRYGDCTIASLLYIELKYTEHSQGRDKHEKK